MESVGLSRVSSRVVILEKVSSSVRVADDRRSSHLNFRLNFPIKVCPSANFAERRSYQQCRAFHTPLLFENKRKTEVDSRIMPCLQYGPCWTVAQINFFLFPVHQVEHVANVLTKVPSQAIFPRRASNLPSSPLQRGVWVL